MITYIADRQMKGDGVAINDGIAVRPNGHFQSIHFTGAGIRADRGGGMNGLQVHTGRKHTAEACRYDALWGMSHAAQ